MSFKILDLDRDRDRDQDRDQPSERRPGLRFGGVSEEAGDWTNLADMDKRKLVVLLEKRRDKETNEEENAWSSRAPKKINRYGILI